MIGVILYFSRGFFGMFLPNPETGSNLEVAYALGALTPTPTPTFMMVQVVPGINVTNQAQPSQTPYPTYTPPPTSTSSAAWMRDTPTPEYIPLDPQTVNWVFSYYFPDLVAQRDENPAYEVNCHPDNWIYSPYGNVIGCKNITASGEPWKSYLMDQSDFIEFRGGVAVPVYPDMQVDWKYALYPAGSILTISSPIQIAGDYLVIDLCGGCNAYASSHGVMFLDFLAEGLPNGINFWDSVVIEKVTYP
ncbi:MAG: hypothetical protein HUU12_02485 [Anaerolineales bacterium]|nr:hypothetical protein [Anaerolineales bacterium]NUQ58235.1 hypothetical protein [Anaerolineales bacterium]